MAVVNTIVEVGTVTTLTYWMKREESNKIKWNFKTSKLSIESNRIKKSNSKKFKNSFENCSFLVKRKWKMSERKKRVRSRKAGKKA